MDRARPETIEVRRPEAANRPLGPRRFLPSTHTLSSGRCQSGTDVHRYIPCPALRFNVTVERTIGGKTLSIETGRLAKQASGAVVVRVGDTMTLVATVAAPGREGLDFFPLHGRLPREGLRRGQVPRRLHQARGAADDQGNPHLAAHRPADPAALPRVLPRRGPDPGRTDLGRPPERRRRPLDDRRLGLADAGPGRRSSARSAPSGSARVDGQFVAFPTAEELENSDLDLVVASTEKAIVMIEGFGEELPEPEMLDAIMEAHRLNQEVIAPPARAARGRWACRRYELPETAARPAPRRRSTTGTASELREAKQIHGKAERNAATKELLRRRTRRRVLPRADGARRAEPGDRHAGRRSRRRSTAVEERVVRELILDGKRPDGRGPRDLRPINCEVGLLPRAHGSAIFQRGETQALVTTVLGTAADEQRVDGIMDEYSKKFMLDYNMPSFAVGEVRPIRGPGRREIGHGALAERSVAPILPELAAVPVHDPRRLRHPRVERLELDGLGLRRDAQPDGRRRADQRPGRRHLDRPGPGRGDRPPHPPDRHHRRRGPLRRHGLQGRRHPARGHGHPARPQEPGDHRADRPRDARPGPRGPARDPPGDAPVDQAAARRDLGQRAAADPDPDQSREDRPGHRARRQDDPPAPGRDRGQDRHRGQRHRHALQHRAPPAPRPPATRSRR